MQENIRFMNDEPPAEPAHMLLDQVTLSLGGRPVLESVSFEVPHGKQVAILGPNGAGKSTLFKAVAGLLPLDSGRIFIHGVTLKRHTDCVAYIPQREEVDWKFPVSVLDVVLMGRFKRLPRLRQPGRKDRDLAMYCLAQLGMQDLARQSIGDLSGGQQQRVFIARALVQEPHILLMDEPFSGVDLATQESTLGLLETLKERQVTVLISTHDLDMASRRFETILMLNHKVIAYGPASGVFTAQTMRETFSGKVLFLDGAAVIDECCPHDEHGE